MSILLERYPSIKRVSFVGIGEPFLNEDLIPMARIAKERGKRVDVITNVSLLHRHWGEIAPNFDDVSISLHGLTAEELKRTAGVDAPMFDQFVSNVRHLCREERGINRAMIVRASVVTLRTDLNRLRRAAIFCAENGIQCLEVQNYLPYGLDDFKECVFDDDSQFITYLNGLIKEFIGVVEIVPPVLIKKDPRRMSWGCLSFFEVLRVDGIGHVCGCNRIMVPKPENGNFKECQDVWNNTYFLGFRRQWKSLRCLPDCCRWCPAAQ